MRSSPAVACLVRHRRDQRSGNLSTASASGSGVRLGSASAWPSGRQQPGTRGQGATGHAASTASKPVGRRVGGFGADSNASGDFSTAVGGCLDAGWQNSTALGNCRPRPSATTAWRWVRMLSRSGRRQRGDRPGFLHRPREHGVGGQCRQRAPDHQRGGRYRGHRCGEPGPAERSGGDGRQHQQVLPGQGSADSDAGAYVEGDNATAAGEATNAIGNGASAFGSGANAYADNATAVGFNALASGQNSAAFGNNAQATGSGSVAVGGDAVDENGDPLLDRRWRAGGYGRDQRRSRRNRGRRQRGKPAALPHRPWRAAHTPAGAAIFGIRCGRDAAGDYRTAVGAESIAIGTSSVLSVAGGPVPGYGFVVPTQATGESASAFGAGAIASGDYSTVAGSLAEASAVWKAPRWAGSPTRLGDNASALGAESWASGDNSTAVGYYSTAFGADSVALGAECNRGCRQQRGPGCRFRCRSREHGVGG